MTATIGRLWKNEYFKTVVMIVVVVAIVFGFWFGSQVVLRTQYPALAVASGSMCEVQADSGNGCDGWSHPFGRTLHTGDLIIIRAVDAKDITPGTEPNGDIIVFHRPRSDSGLADELIVHRGVKTMMMNGLVYFETKGDWSGPSGVVDSWGRDYRGSSYAWEDNSGQWWVSEKLVVGVVLTRIPWVGHLALYMRDSSALYVIIAIIIVLIIVEFALPTSRSDKTGAEQAKSPESTVETPSAASKKMCNSLIRSQSNMH